MKLNIGDNNSCDMENDVYNIARDSLKYSGVHMFIASNKWDSVHVEVTDDIPTSQLKYLPIVTDNITVTLPEKVTMDTIGILVSLFPKKSGVLRRTFMSGGNIQEVLG